LAVVVPEEIESAELLACARQNAPPIVQALHIFDVYRGAGIESGRKSLALGLILQDYSRTLTDDEVARAMAEVRAGLHEGLGATIRD
jgi:phenylalanyl-tRNA synthetase beta chain